MTGQRNIKALMSMTLKMVVLIIPKEEPKRSQLKEDLDKLGAID